MIFLFLIVLFFASPIFAVDYYVSPSGAGSTCSTGTPCSLQTGITSAGNGDKVILKDGTYTTGIDTQADGVTFEAENRHLAIIQKDGSGSFRHLSVEHSNTTVRSIRFDATNYTGGAVEKKGAAFRFGGLWRGISIQGLLIEDNIFENSPNAGPGIHALRDSIFRFNTVDDTGYNAPGEGFYIGEAGGSQPVTNVEIYGNTIKNYTQQCFDLKEDVGPIDIHHNICEIQAYKTNPSKPATEGGATIRSILNRYHDNIMRNGVGGPTASGNLMEVTGDGGAGGGDIAEDNVFYNMSGHFRLLGCNKIGAGPNSIIRNNLFCNASPYTTEAGCSGVDFVNNTTNAAQSLCDAEETRILTERTQLPGYPDAATPECNDSIDNDGDGDTDYPADAGCSSLQDNTELGPLVAHYTFDNVVTDSSGNGINGTLMNGATYDASGQVNQALTLDGSNDYVTLGTNAKLDIGPAFSIMAWVKSTGGGIHNIFSKWSGSASGYRALIGVDDDANVAPGVLSFSVETPTATNAEEFEGTIDVVNDGGWHHIAITTISGATVFYVDGAQSDTGTSEVIVAPTGIEARVGSRSDGAGYWDGEIDELKIYNVALLAGDVLAEYNAGLGGDIGLSFPDLSGQAVSTVVSSSTAVITPTNGTAVSISESCSPACTAQYQIYQGDCSTVEHAWTAVAGTVDNGECVGLRLSTDSTFAWSGSATITVGSFSDTWQVTTLFTPPDPDLFPASSKASGGVTLSGGVTAD